jgi:hypothetical protein
VKTLAENFLHYAALFLQDDAPACCPCQNKMIGFEIAHLFSKL